ncbi:hypothetical protein [Deinococcus peraridilitoris]|uniref:Uncharacterized protein n=1 Tax=Deinococcus peraridilitoris (strain DSM 19664 / LMG 22246 / CIP 109416 / KR-200) TaxID=937777 RepID=L0A830_DEIPD|nr:hypothetical protein [Deinococcus peraridilitoris]AFZ69210.1 hypothetical protein Deipe_3786 [Deinococcus peraridilitoris DSM 19664]
MRRPILLLVALVSGGALAWAPKLDNQSAKAVLDTAYNRTTQPVSTVLNIDLSVKEGAFATKDAVRVFDGDPGCLTSWAQDPSAYAQHGSRPTSVTLTGQADELFLQAQQARDSFKNLTVQDALKPREGGLPEGHLRVYVGMAGLENEKLRDAYNVALRTPDGKIVQPYRRAFTSDWKQAGEGSARGRWSGSMVYYFDAAKAGLNATSKADVLIRTEADNDCAFAVGIDLAKFY